MGGRKHPLQNSFMTNQSFDHIKDPIERDLAYRSVQAAPYCKHCGKVIVQASQDEFKNAVDVNWEMANQAHYSCFTKWQDEEKTRLAKAAREEQKRREEENRNFDWDSYMEKMFEDRNE